MVERYAEQPHTAEASPSRLTDYVADLWNKPEDHLVEIGIAGVAVATALTPVARIGLKALLQKEGGVAGEAAMSSAAIKKTLENVRSLSFELDSGFSKLVGRTGPNGERILSTADNNAFRLNRLNGAFSDSVYAHELVLPKGANNFTARFMIDSQHSHTWSTMSKPAWPNGKTGIWSNLNDAGINVQPRTQNPLKLEFGNDMSHLEISSVSGNRFGVSIDAALEGRVKAVGQSAVSNRVSSISIEGQSSVRNGNGLINVHGPESKIDRSHLYRYPEVQPGGVLRVYYDPAATIRPALAPDVRYMTKNEGLVRPV